MTGRRGRRGKERREAGRGRVAGEKQRTRRDLRSAQCPRPQPPALRSPAVFDLSHGSSHLLPGEAGRPRGQSSVISAAERQALPSPAPLLLLLELKSTTRGVCVCVCVCVCVVKRTGVGALCPPKRGSGPKLRRP